MEEIPAIFAASLERAPWGWALLGTVVLALVKIWPLMTQLSIDAKAKIRGENREDLNDCHRQLREVRSEVRALSDSFNNLKIELAASLSAYRILEVEVETTNPSSIGLAEARAILRTAFAIAPSGGGPAWPDSHPNSQESAQ